MLLNLSNHNSKNWKLKQKDTAIELYGSIYDMEFPEVDPNSSEEEILKLVSGYEKKICLILSEHKNENNAVHIMGEMTFCFALINRLLRRGIECIASTTERIVPDNLDGFKISKFNFVKFRKYIL